MERESQPGNGAGPEYIIYLLSDAQARFLGEDVLCVNRR
jgi:hypothetical protein